MVQLDVWSGTQALTELLCQARLFLAAEQGETEPEGLSTSPEMLTGAAAHPVLQCGTSGKTSREGLPRAAAGTAAPIGLSLPLRGRVLAVQGVFQLDDIAVLLPQQPLLLSVVLHQLCEGGKLLPSIQVIVIPCVLDLNVRHLIVPPGEERQMGLSVGQNGHSASLPIQDACPRRRAIAF